METKPIVVLIAEDELLVRMLTADILADEGDRMIEAHSGDEALQILEMRSDVRVLLTDVDMSGSLNCYSLARVVEMRWPAIGVIVSSGKTHPSPGDLPKKARFIGKPYVPSALLKDVRAVLGSGDEPITVTQPGLAERIAVPALPSAIKVDQPHTGIGPAGGLAQSLREPEK